MAKTSRSVPVATNRLRFLWWNLQDFAHFDPAPVKPAPVKVRRERFPASAKEHARKRRRVLDAFGRLFGNNPPEVVALCELTKDVADDLHRTVFPGHDLILSNPGDKHAFQIAMFLRNGLPGLSFDDPSPAPWVADRVTEATRPMLLANCSTPRAEILFVACHWTALDVGSSREARRNCAARLGNGIYDFLFPNPVRNAGAVPRHVVVLGDFNEEPHDELFNATLYASRDRDYARSRRHYTDVGLSRVRLYNCAWRHLGEIVPHSPLASGPRAVGTYYSATHGWRTYDQVLVTGSLLASTPPYLDEAALAVRTDVGGQVNGLPAKFEFDGRVATGLSDHYPVSGHIVLN